MPSNLKNVRLRDHQLSKRRKALGLTQHQLSAATGISVNRIVFAETGRASLEPDEREKVMAVLRTRAKRVIAMVA